jgi:hypothetical protein
MSLFGGTWLITGGSPQRQVIYDVSGSPDNASPNIIRRCRAVQGLRRLYPREVNWLTLSRANVLRNQAVAERRGEWPL